jgi:hypothetical protein
MNLLGELVHYSKDGISPTKLQTQSKIEQNILKDTSFLKSL